MKCTCGAEYGTDDKYCPGCGREIHDREEYSIQSDNNDMVRYSRKELAYLKESRKLKPDTILVRYPEGIEIPAYKVVDSSLTPKCTCGNQYEKGASVCSHCGRVLDKTGYGIPGDAGNRLYNRSELIGLKINGKLKAKDMLIKFPEGKEIQAEKAIALSDLPVGKRPAGKGTHSETNASFVPVCTCGSTFDKKDGICKKCGRDLMRNGFGIVGSDQPPVVNLYSSNYLNYLMEQGEIESSTKLIEFPKGKPTTVGEVLSTHKINREVSYYKINQEASPVKEKRKVYPAGLTVGIILAAFLILIAYIQIEDNKYKDISEPAAPAYSSYTGSLSSRVSKANYYRITRSMSSEDVQEILGSPDERTNNGVRIAHIWRSGDKTIKVVYHGRSIVEKSYQDWTDIDHLDVEYDSY